MNLVASVQLQGSQATCDTTIFSSHANATADDPKPPATRPYFPDMPMRLQVILGVAIGVAGTLLVLKVRCIFS